MSTITASPPPVRHGEVTPCSTTGNVTRALLGYLALAGPMYVAVSLVEALTRPGFSLVRDEWSLLALGHLGWVHMANLLVVGAMIVAGASGVRRALGRSSGGTWAPRLAAGYGLALIAAGIFHADPANGFPPGAPSGRPTELSWHGTMHVVSGSIGFSCLIALCFVMARSYSRRAERRAATASRLVGLVFAAVFAGIATGANGAAINLAFTAAVGTSCAWLTAVAVDLYRRTRQQELEADIAS